ncbi:hypothetical protein M2311_000260 [Rhizobium leguminosarum]|nr:hypothetical protein [Rhizobium leguminosarum]
MLGEAPSSGSGSGSGSSPGIRSGSRGGVSTGGGDGGGTIGSFGTDMGASSLRERGKSPRVPLTLDPFDTICCDMPKTKTKSKETDDPELIREWPLPVVATLGSGVRVKGILQEIRSRLPPPVRKSLNMQAGGLILVMPETSKTAFRATASAVSSSLEGIADLPVIPREIEDILTITASERKRWLEDGRLLSAGTRTIRLQGRARRITFHVFDPRVVEDLLDRGAVDEWREEDAAAKAENRRRAAHQAKLTRSLKKKEKVKEVDPNAEDAATGLSGWDEFGSEGLLR